jgi:hypothetical protein
MIEKNLTGNSFPTWYSGADFFGSVSLTRSHKMKWNHSLNTTNGLLAKMELSYVTTCFGLFLWPSSGCSVVELRVYTVCLKVG